MNSELCQDLIHHLDGGNLAVGDAPKDVQGWLEELGLPTDLLRFMQWHWPQNGADVKHLYLRSSREIRSDRDTQKLLAHKLLNVGSGPNGDLLVIDFSAERFVPGFVSHDELWENEDSNPRDCFQPIARSLESLLFRLAEARYIPTDYYAARAFNEFLAQEDRANV